MVIGVEPWVTALAGQVQRSLSRWHGSRCTYLLRVGSPGRESSRPWEDLCGSVEVRWLRLPCPRC